MEKQAKAKENSKEKLSLKDIQNPWQLIAYALSHPAMIFSLTTCVILLVLILTTKFIITKNGIIFQKEAIRAEAININK